MPHSYPHQQKISQPSLSRRRTAQEQTWYVHSWECQGCRTRFMTFQADASPQRPDATACPWCHVVGRLKHWKVKIPSGRRIGDLFPWPGSESVDAEDALQLQEMLALSAPSARAYYERTGIAPWARDQRPQPDPQPEYVTVKEAAEQMGIAPRTCRRWLHTQKLRGFKAGTYWLVRRQGLLPHTTAREEA